MKKTYTGLFILLVSLAACQNRNTSNTTDLPGTALATDTLTYAYDSVKVSSKLVPAANTAATDTAKAVISYPVFEDTSLNDFIQGKVTTISKTDEKSEAKTYQEIVTAFINDFDTFKKQYKESAQIWFLDTRVEVLQQIPGYLPAKCTAFNYMGGAHPNTVHIYINYDLNKKQEILLDSLLVPDGIKELTAVAEKIFRKNEKLSPDASLKDTYFFENDVFKLPSNFTITKEGLKFLYNPYEIKAYVYGTTELLMPFSEIKTLLKPNPILSTVLN